MKTLIITSALIASILANAISAQAAPRPVHFDAAVLFNEIANQGGE
jgi:hypothetical protein